MGSGKSGSGDGETTPTESGTTHPGQQQAWDTMFNQINALGPAPAAVDPGFLSQGRATYENVLGGGYRDALRTAALNQSVAGINSEAVQAGRYGSLGQNAALQNAGISAEVAAMAPELQAAWAAPQAAMNFDPAYQAYLQQVAGIGNLQNLSAGDFGSFTREYTGADSSGNPLPGTTPPAGGGPSGGKGGGNSTYSGPNFNDTNQY